MPPRIIKSLPPHTITLREGLGDYVSRMRPERVAELQRPRSKQLQTLIANFNLIPIVRWKGKQNLYEQTAGRMAANVTAAGRAACTDCELSAFCSDKSGEATSSWNLEVQCDKSGCPETGIEAAADAVARLALKANQVLTGIPLPEDS